MSIVPARNRPARGRQWGRTAAGTYDRDRCRFRTNGKGERVVVGPVDKMRLGPVVVREWGRDVPVEIKRLGRPFVNGGVKMRYGYLDGA